MSATNIPNVEHANPRTFPGDDCDPDIVDLIADSEDEKDPNDVDCPEDEEGFASMRELYDALDNGDGDPVYLSDGMWLYPDGSIED